MKSILVIGVGHFGRHLIRKLNELNTQVMAVDIDEESVNAVLSYVDSAQIGDSTNVEFLSQLGVSDFDAVIVTITDDFQTSLETASLLKDLGARHVVSRASSDIQEKFLLRNGADEVVYPEKQLAAWTCIRCTSDHVFDYIDLGGEHSIFEVSVPNEWVGRNVLQINVRQQYGINILGVRKNGILNTLIKPETTFEAGTTVLVLGAEKTITKYFKI
ncbi:MAG: TrkA family potassium uptake protein [Lachnospiraceae bacterium]|nr:TrkA family potassium uptake protein [Lachnospiraceae bacterium]